MRSNMPLSSALVSLLLGVATTVTATTPNFLGYSSHILPRADEAPVPQEVCSDLTISSNNGDRKVAIVIDSSGSMADSDPQDFRLVAARALNEFLISNSEAGGGKPDQVVVIGFDYSSYLVFGPGDPGDPEADKEIGLIQAGGGTYIAGGVLQAIDEIGKMSGDTNGRSAIVVFTDGSDSDTITLVDAIKNATSLGIRVSFGFLDLSANYQPEDVLLAVRESKGVYATITFAAGTRNFVNYVLLNGLTYQDNPQGAGDRLLSGLATTQFIDGPNPVTLKYSASQGEKANFTLVSITGDPLNVEAKMNGQTLNSSKPDASGFSFSDTVITVEPPGNGELEVIITADGNPVNGLFSVATNSNQPVKNCTVGVSGNNTGLSTGAKAGLGVGITALLLGLAGGGFWAYKHFMGGSPSGAAPASSAPAGANTTAGPTGAEKFGAHTNVYPVDPSQGIAPTGGEPGYGQVHTMIPDGGAHMAGQSLTGGGGGGAGANGFAPMGSSPAPPMGIPPTGGVAPPAAMASVPSVFVPPLVPPNVFKPGGSNSKPGTPNPDGVSPQHTDFNHPQQPVNTTDQTYPYQNVNPSLGSPPGAQQPLGNYNGYQNVNPSLGNPTGAQQPLGSYNGYQNALPHGGGSTTGIQPSTTSGTPLTPGSGHDLNHTNWTPPIDPNHTGIAPTNHTNIGIPGDGTSTNYSGHVSTTNYYSAPPTQPLPPGVGGINNPGFTMPGAQVRMGFGAASQDRGSEERHHHHPWLAPDSACEQAECPMNLSSHQCVPDRERCECSCRDAGCPFLRRG